MAINDLTEMPRSQAVANGSHALIVATRRYVGEGFDARLDTLFPTMPISWQGTSTQSAGRLRQGAHRLEQGIVAIFRDASYPSA